LGFFQGVHYNGGHPAIAKASQIFAEARWNVCLLGNHFRRATMRLIAGIIDCAFENSEKLCRNLRFQLAITDTLKLASRRNPSIRILGKIFPQKTFPPSLFRTSGGFQDE
jgi:hypothetical protein